MSHPETSRTHPAIDEDAATPRRGSALTRRRPPGPLAVVAALLLGSVLAVMFFLVVGVLFFLPHSGAFGQDGEQWAAVGLLASMAATPVVAAVPLFLVLRGRKQLARDAQGAEVSR